jgi:hypothetical protein
MAFRLDAEGLEFFRDHREDFAIDDEDTAS